MPFRARRAVGRRGRIGRGIKRGRRMSFKRKRGGFKTRSRVPGIRIGYRM